MCTIFLPFPSESDLEFHSVRSSKSKVCQINKVRLCGCHTFSSWSHPHLFNVFASLLPLHPLHIHLQSFTLFSFLCKITTLLPAARLRSRKILTRQPILRYLPPLTLQRPPALQDLLGLLSSCGDAEGGRDIGDADMRRCGVQ